MSTESCESAVRSYSRSFPVVFDRSLGSLLYDEAGRRYIDFLAGAGSLNYGHNNPHLKQALIEYLRRDGVTLSLDLATTARCRFMERFTALVLKPRGYDYLYQFTGPTGANGVEAALKLARKVTGRRNIVAFSGSYHGLSSGALATTSNTYYRHESFVNRTDVSFLPYEGYLGDVDTIPVIARMLTDPSSGVDHPAAVILETVQGEGGINVASVEWLRAVQELCKNRGILLIVDDIQVGNGRTGDYFSFEDASLEPDIVILSKSIGGFGLPMTLLLLKPGIDRWSPGEHTGTFRGNNLAFVAGAAALDFWKNGDFAATVRGNGTAVSRCLKALAATHPEEIVAVRGRGLIHGLELRRPSAAAEVRRLAFNDGLIVELCGARDNVLKILPPLTIEREVLEEGLVILTSALQRCAN